MFAFGVQNAAAFNFDATSNPKLPTTDEKTKINIPTEKHDIDTLKDQVSGLKFVLKTTRTEVSTSPEIVTPSPCDIDPFAEAVLTPLTARPALDRAQ